MRIPIYLKHIASFLNQRPLERTNLQAQQMFTNTNVAREIKDILCRDKNILSGSSFKMLKTSQLLL